MADVQFEVLKGKTITEIIGEVDAVEIAIKCSDGTSYKMYHRQDCCESVYVEDVCGDYADVIGVPILLAEEACSEDDPPGYVPEEDSYRDDSQTWTFYKLATIKGAVTIRWYGESNGYYSEEVDFEETTP